MNAPRTCTGCRYGACIRCDHANCACGNAHPWPSKTRTSTTTETKERPR